VRGVGIFVADYTAFKCRYKLIVKKDRYRWINPKADTVDRKTTTEIKLIVIKIILKNLKAVR